MNWISVEDRLPPKAEENVLICRGNRVSIGYYEQDVDKTWTTWHDDTEQYGDEGWPSEIEVTHWMPLPDAPAPQAGRE